MNRFISLLKKEPVLIVSAICAVISMFFYAPSAEYIGYINFRVLCLLFSLMAVVAGFTKCGLFDILAQKVIKKCHSSLSLGIILVMLTFFCSMFITNDVSLITFVPFTILLLGMTGQRKNMILIIVLQTVAANLGSMAIPIGNPQNLYLVSEYNISGGDFFSVMTVYTVISLILVLGGCFLIKREKIDMPVKIDTEINSRRDLAVYAVLFAISFLAVFRVVSYVITTAVTFIVILIMDREIFKKVDFLLLLTFVFFFIFSGNLGNIDSVSGLLSEAINKNTMLTSVIASQFISNVPAAVLLSGFTGDWKSLLIGTNIGGLGTPIASMASLISLKLYMNEKDAENKKYMLVFLAVNIICLAVLLAAEFIIG